MTIYEDIAAYFEAEDKGWCTGSMLRNTGTSAPACLVGGVRAVVGAAYLKPNGKMFISKDRKKWARAEKVINRIGEHIHPGFTPPEYEAETLFPAHDYSPWDEEFSDDLCDFNVEMPRYHSAVIQFNDNVPRTPTEQATLTAVRDEFDRVRDQDPYDREAIQVAFDKLVNTQKRLNATAQKRQKAKVIKTVRQVGALHPND